METLGWLLVLAIAALAILFGVLAYGVRLGQELAVDGTRRRGYFLAYGKRWRAREISSSVPPSKQIGT